MFRGILSTLYISAKRGISINKIHNCLNSFFRKSEFVKIMKVNSSIGTNAVMNTNKCIISVCKTKHKNKFVILSSLDNLIKGGSGQAIQNMNLKFSFPSNRGLK